MFVDETGFFMHPMVRRTWIPGGLLEELDWTLHLPEPEPHKRGRESFFFPSTKMQQVGARLEDELQAHLTALDQ